MISLSPSFTGSRVRVRGSIRTTDRTIARAANSTPATKTLPPHPALLPARGEKEPPGRSRAISLSPFLRGEKHRSHDGRAFLPLACHGMARRVVED